MYSLLHSLRKTGNLLNVSHTTVARWIQHPERKPYSRKAPKCEVLIQCIKTFVEATPLVSLRKLKHVIQTTLDICLSKELVRTILLKAGYTRKKARHFGQPPNLEEKTKSFLEKRENLKAKGYTFLSLDETSFGRNNTKSFGYALKGKKLSIKKKQPRVTTTSVMAIYSQDGHVNKVSSTKPFNSQSYLDFLKGTNFPSRSVLLLDNVSFHHSIQALQFLKSSGVMPLFVPPYSPWFNPIEGVFSIIKRHYYDNECIEDAFNSVTKEHCLAFFQKSLNATAPF